ncbi:STAS domain-containing protein [Bacillus tianshenii]|nr:STAS domain-containing protein [Bacillus tianshenii]
MITFQEANSTLNITINTDINFETTREMELILQDYDISSNITELNLDFKGVRFVDSTGVSLLIKWLHPLTNSKIVRIHNASAPIKNVLRICKLEQFVEVM